MRRLLPSPRQPRTITHVGHRHAKETLTIVVCHSQCLSLFELLVNTTHLIGYLMALLDLRVGSHAGHHHLKANRNHPSRTILCKVKQLYHLIPFRLLHILDYLEFLHSKQRQTDKHLFSFQAFTVWSNLPQTVRYSMSVSSFKSSLKTYLFSK